MGDHLGRPGAERRDGLLSSSTRGKDKRGGWGWILPPQMEKPYLLAQREGR